jgi:hypothetical protein
MAEASPVFSTDEADQLAYAANLEGGNYSAADVQAIGSGAGAAAVALMKMLAAYVKTHRG